MTNVDTTAPKPERSATQRIARNTVIGVGAQIALKVAGAIFQILVVRQLGGAQFGEYSSVLAWAGLFSVLGDMGVTQYLAREVARDKNKTNELFWDTVCFRFVLAIITIAITTVGAIIWGYSSEIVLATGIFTISYLFQSLIAPLSGILTGNERLDIISLLAVITQVIFYIFAGLFLFLHLDFVWLAIASTIQTPIIMGLTYWFVRRNQYGPPQFHINPRMWPSLLRMGIPFALIQLSLSFSFRIDTVILSKYVSNNEIGWYNVAYNLILMISGVIYSFSGAILPTLAKEHATDPESIKPWYYHSTRIFLFIGLPTSLAITLMSDKIIHFLYQPQIAPAAIPLMILIWDLPAVMYHSFCGNLVQSMKLEGKGARVYASLGIANVILNIILIPHLGILGACFSTVLTDGFGAMQYYFIMRHVIGSGLRFYSIAKIFISTIAMGILLYAISSWNLFVMIIIGGSAYLIFIWISKAFSETEINQLRKLILDKSPSIINKKLKKDA